MQLTCALLHKGVLRGQDLFLVLAEYLGPARSQTDFDHLAIPFRAVASDIETGQAVVMGSGDIATAVFASMAVPGGLPPVERIRFVEKPVSQPLLLRSLREELDARDS